MERHELVDRHQPDPHGRNRRRSDRRLVSERRCAASPWARPLRKATQQRLVLRITPQSRSIVNVPVPSGTRLSNLSGVSCATTVNCFAVGDFRLGPTRRPLLEWYS